MAPKRQSNASSSNGGQAKRAKKTDSGSGSAGLTEVVKRELSSRGVLPEYIPYVQNILETTLTAHGSLEKYLQAEYPSLSSLQEMIDDRFPALPITYMQQWQGGPQVLRPWRLAFESSSGTKGLLLHEHARILVSLILLQGFRNCCKRAGPVRHASCLSWTSSARRRRKCGPPWTRRPLPATVPATW